MHVTYPLLREEAFECLTFDLFIDVVDVVERDDSVRHLLAVFNLQVDTDRHT